MSNPTQPAASLTGRYASVPIDRTAEPRDALEGQRLPPIVPIVNAHEHVQDRGRLPCLLEAFDRTGVETAVILGSPRYTYWLGKAGFTDYDSNNEEVMTMAALH